MITLRSFIYTLLLIFPSLVSAADPGVPATLRIGTSGDYPPIAFMENGTFQGIEADLAAQIGKDLGTNTRIVQIPFKELIPALLNNKIDVIMTGMSITADRKQKVLFTDPYMEIGQMALIRDSELVKWSRQGSFYTKGVRVGVRTGSTGDQFASTRLTDAVITRFDHIDNATDALQNQEIDVFIHDAPTIWRLSAQTATQKAGLMGLYRPLTSEHLAWAVRPDDKALANALNAELEKLKKANTVSRVTRRWIPVAIKIGK